MVNDAIYEFVEAIRQEPQDVNNTYNAVVSKVDAENVVWVYLVGSNKETPTASTSSEVQAGDVVTVEWRNNRLYIAGNYSNPSAGVIRVDAVEMAANVAREAANNAVSEAGRAKDAADHAEQTAIGVEAIAQRAQATAEQVEGIARAASDYADLAYKHADDVQKEADRAAYHLTQIESIIDVLNWVSEHGQYRPTDDEIITEGKWYFLLQNDGTYVVGSPIENPKTEGFYELEDVDEAISSYIFTHLWLDEEGLHVSMSKDNGASQMVLSGTSIKLKDNYGDVIAEYTDSVTLGKKNGPHLELSPVDGLGFFQDENTKVSYIKENKLFIANAEVTTQLRIGKFIWIVRSENRISLRYEPDEE